MKENIVAQVIWCSIAPAGVAQVAHNMSFVEAVEKASTLLRTDYSEQEEKLIIGVNLRAMLTTIPQFDYHGSSNSDCFLLPKIDGKIWLGTLSRRRKVLLDLSKEMDDLAYLDNGREKACIKVVNDDLSHITLETLRLFKAAKVINPKLYFDLSWSLDTGWRARLIDQSVGGKILAQGQCDQEDDVAINEACKPVLAKLREMGYR